MLGPKMSQGIQIILMIGKRFSNHNGMKLKISCRKKARKKMWEINNMLLNIQWVTEEIKAEIKKKKKNLDTNDNRSTIYHKTYGRQQKV